MKHFTYILLSVILVFTSCGNKKLDDKSVCGVYPHLLKAEKEFVKELNKLSKEVDAESEKEKVRIKDEIFDLIAKDTTTLSHEFGPLSDIEEFDIVTSPNVYEWCQDWYGDYSSLPQTNPQGPSEGSYHVCRGGCMCLLGYCCRVTDRGLIEPDSFQGCIGLRLAMSID